MTAPEAVKMLVERFSSQLDSYRNPSYNETQLRREFVDPLFRQLGWDVDNERGYAEAYKDVVHEDSIRIEGGKKAPDYAFRIGGVRKFFVETKKPATNINKDPSAAFQLRRYAWSAKLPLSILTDFEEMAVYDCRFRPAKTDKASTARLMYMSFTEYGSRWEEISSVFSRESILKGSFDRHAEASKARRGTAEVDDSFLAEIESWREALAHDIGSSNPSLTQRELNACVQKTIDRIVFLRICEDRGIEPYGQLRTAASGENVYKEFARLFRKADDRFNSGIFHFRKEAGRPEAPDAWTLDLAVSDVVLKSVVANLYYPDSPYEFSVLGADILGHIYEQFLGQVVRLREDGSTVIEEKPEVKKAGGVYYTPTYIVDFILSRTMDPHLVGKTPADVAGRTPGRWKPAKGKLPLSVLDPACGSGSFLIGAYQRLLDWYRDWYVEDGPAKYSERIYEARKDEWRLTSAR